jgi:CheY-like chemotaxis protein
MNKVLVVMSDLFFSGTINDTAKRLGATITVVQNEAKFHERLQDQPVALIFDLNCTTVDPIGLIAKVKADEATKRIPVVCFYPHVQTNLAERATAAGADAVLRRSVFVDTLPGLLARFIATAEERA